MTNPVPPGGSPINQSDELARLKLENAALRIALARAKGDLFASRATAARYQAVNAELRERIDHLLDQPLIIIEGDAFVGSRDYQRPCPN